MDENRDEYSPSNDQNESNNVFLLDNFQSAEDLELNNRIRTDFINQCLTVLQEDEETRQTIEASWKKTSRWTGEAPILSNFLDHFPLNVKKSGAIKFQEEIRRCFTEMFRCDASIVVSSLFQSDFYVHVLRYVLKHFSSINQSGKTAIIYVSSTFEPDLIADLRSSIGNVKFESVAAPHLFEDTIDVDRLAEAIQRDAAKENSYPAAVFATAGTNLLGHSDDLTKIKTICEENNVWLHVSGDLLGSLPFITDNEKYLEISADSFTLDASRLFAVQGLPYLTFFLRRENELIQLNEHPSYDLMIENPSIGYITAWSIGQRCSNEQILHHLKYSFELMNFFDEKLQHLTEFRIVNEEKDPSKMITYKNFFKTNSPKKSLPKTVLIFRFEPTKSITSEIDEENSKHIDILNLWLHDKIVDLHPKLNFDLLKSLHFSSSTTNGENGNGFYGIRFAPIEHFFELAENEDVDKCLTDLKNFSEILLATIDARNKLSICCEQFSNLQAVQLSQWAGIGAVRYIPSEISLDAAQSLDGSLIYRINSIQAELSRKLQHKDSAFSLGTIEAEENPLYFLRLGMIKKIEDLDILLKKIAETGAEVEQSLKYVEDMAEKIKNGIEQVQKDLQDENLRSISEAGILRTIPLVSNFMSWWSPIDDKTPRTKGRSYDLNTGRIESTEEIYLHRMQIQKAPVAETHTNHAAPSFPPSNE